MRKIEERMMQAIRHHENWKSGNTEVITRYDNEGGETIIVNLHGNRIFEQYERMSLFVQYFTLAGWNTPTTRSRLRALGIDIRQKNGSACYMGEAISDSTWYSATK